MQSNIKNDLVYLLRILEPIGKIQLYIADFEEAINFFRANDQQNFNASIMLLINIGEQSNRIDHDYIGIDRFITFDILQNELPILKRQLEQIVRLEMLEGNFDKEEYNLAQTSEYYTHIDYKNID